MAAQVNPTIARSTQPLRWKDIVDEPLNRYYRYPLAKLLVRLLVKTPITPNQVTFVQPVLGAVAGWLISHQGHGYMIAAAIAYEFRSILDCADGSLARAKNMCTPKGHAIDG